MLAIAYHLGARNVQAHDGSYFKVLGGAVVLAGDAVYVVKPNPPSWQQLTGNDLPPVPPASLVFWGGTIAITNTGEGWERGHCDTWCSFGFVPSGAISVQPETWTGVKEKYRK